MIRFSEDFSTTSTKIYDAQRHDKHLSQYFKHGGAAKTNRYKISVVKDTRVVTDNGKLMISPCLQKDKVACYHHYLQHPGASRSEEILRATVTWDGLQKDVHRHTES